MKSLRLQVTGLLAGLTLAACSAVDVSEELKVVSIATDGLGSSIRTPAFNIKLAKEQEILGQHEIDVAVADLWVVGLTDGCLDIIARELLSGAPKCSIKTEVSAERKTASIQAPPLDAVDVDRKLRGLSDYVDAISTLASATNETDIQNAFAAAVAEIEALAATEQASGLAEFATELSDNRGKIDAVVSFSVKALRARRLKTVVLEHDESLQRVVLEMLSKLSALGFDQAYTDAVTTLGTVNATTVRNYGFLRVAVLTKDQAAILTAKTAYRDSIVSLYEAEKTFQTQKRLSLSGKLIGLRAAHGALAGRLSKPANVDETLAFLETVKALSDTLKE